MGAAGYRHLFWINCINGTYTLYATDFILVGFKRQKTS